ncbi:outer membrane beta-barrel protein [Mucilaginibacter sp.]|uniref:outer membrane beta-barrel protein n=1 Tax=Mucilaginibacter sp. TaxID=1882438 RepID=UPI00260C2D83|nr:outer membrane beta-barrel protein [Mucilaginibacter sp.]MDB4921618.1 hypothetical protein [Mucilaginibacter sp.]
MKHFYKLGIFLFFIPFFTSGQTNTDYDKHNFYLGAALNATTTSSSSASPFYGSGGRPYTSYLPALSFGISVPADPNTGKLVFRGELLVSLAKYSSLYQNKVYPYIGVRASYNELGISFTPQVIYNFYNADNFKFYGGIGIALANSFYSNVNYGSQDPNTPFLGDNNYDFVQFDTRGLLKAGIQLHKKWEVYFNYLTSGGTTNRGYFQLNKTNKQVGINYIF